MMKMIGKHKNIINLLGACTQDGRSSDPVSFLTCFLGSRVVELNQKRPCLIRSQMGRRACARVCV